MILQGDALEELRKLPDKCCSVCVTSPPYYNARDYGAADQLGTESSPEEYTRKLVAADGGLWKSQAVDNVKNYLVKALADVPERERITIIA